MLCFFACSQKNTSQTTIVKEPEIAPAPVDTPAVKVMPPEGPVAGSVLDVVSPGSRSIPRDVLQAMAKLGADTKHGVEFWHTHVLDANDDGARELLISNVMDWCGSGGCGVWLWQRTRKGLRNLLPTDSILAEAIDLEAESFDGYHNIRVYYRKSGGKRELMLASDLYVWRDSAYAFSATTRHGAYHNTPLPATAWKVVP